MAGKLRKAAVTSVRRSLRSAARSSSLRRALASSARTFERTATVASREIGAAVTEAAERESSRVTGSNGTLPGRDGHSGSGSPSGSGDDGLYGAAYFGEGRNPASREELSGYASYDRVSSNANLQAYVTWRVFDARTTLDVGCAVGWSVEAFREVGFDTEGIEYSSWAVEHCAPGADGHIRQGDLLEGLPFDDAAFDLVTAFEILEHLPPDEVPTAVAEIRRVARSFVFATIPTFGPNEHGPDGWFLGKVLNDRLDHYDSLPPTYDGPVPHEDLMRDREGNPIEGHLTIASFSWWQHQFEATGLVRCRELERRLYPLIDPLGLTGRWNLYVLQVPGAELPGPDLRSPAEVADLGRRWGLNVT